MMPVKFIQHGGLWTAEVTPPHGQWHSPQPSVIGRLLEALRSEGLRETDIDEGLREVTKALQEAADIKRQKYWDDEILPKVKAALAGTYEVPPQPPFTEAWLAYTLFDMMEPLVPLRDVVDTADALNHATPNADEIAWAFLMMMRRGWLVEKDDLFGLTDEGRHAIRDIVGEAGMYDQMKRLEDWTQQHSPRRDI